MRRGVFVTLGHNGTLRGCVGSPIPGAPLEVALAEAAESATEDPRFPPVRAREIAHIEIEVSVLSTPRPLRARRASDLPTALHVGSDGLLLRVPGGGGLLLPKVAIEHGFTAEQFLSACCLKAGLSPDAWLSNGLAWETFGAFVFREETPRGTIHAEQATPRSDVA